MKSLFLRPCVGLSVVFLAVGIVRGQDAETPPAPAASGGRDAYQSTQLKNFPRDEQGLLKPEIWDIVAAEAKLKPGTNEERILGARDTMKQFYATYAGWKAPEPPAPTPGKLRNLSDTPKEPRFPLTDKVWPEKPGEASICLWEDDKLAAMSLGVDDNCAMDLDTWKEIAKKYGGLNITWNLIVWNMGGVYEKGHGIMAGNWDQWQKMLAEGYHIASHSMTHNHDPVPADGWPGPAWETSESQRLIDEHLPGHKTTLFAIPGSGVHAFGILDTTSPTSPWRQALVKYYLSVRGGGAQPMNQANMIDYFNIHSTTAVQNIVDSKDPKYAAMNLNNLFAADPKDPNHKYYRGWANTFIHFINEGKNFDANPYNKVLVFYNEHRNDLWTGFTDDVAIYGQERDTGTVTTTEATDKKISLTLTSQMDPVTFTYPLTVKVRLPDAWKGVAATQKGAAIPVEVITHDKGRFALVKAKPDQGTIELTPKAS